MATKKEILTLAKWMHETFLACPEAKTKDGFELQFGSNHLGHFVTTCLLAPALLRGAPSRVVVLSSRGHHISPVVFDDIQFERRPYEKWQSYGQAKTANVLFAVGLEKRLGGRGVHANALHPGGIMTELGRHLTTEDFEFLRTYADRLGEHQLFTSWEDAAAYRAWYRTRPWAAGESDGGELHVLRVDGVPSR